MNATLKLAAVAVLAVAIGLGLAQVRPAADIGGTDASSSPTPKALPMPDGPLSAGSYVMTPFLAPGNDACVPWPQAPCIDPSDDDGIRVTLTVPDGWNGSATDGVARAEFMGRPALIIVRGGSLAADPCHNDKTGDIPVGPSAAQFVHALERHPLLSVSDPIDVTVGGHPGTYLELQVPDDPTIQGSPDAARQEGCPVYRPWLSWYLAQGPSELWRLWILDVDGVRVVLQGLEDPATPADAKAELEGIVSSVRLERVAAPAASSSPGPLTWSPARLSQDWPASVRAEPAGKTTDARFQGSGEERRFSDPADDLDPSAGAWVDIRSVGWGNERTIQLAGALPSPIPDPAEAWIAYGVVVDEDGDGAADWRLGVDNLPAGAGHRAWRTDLRTGLTESAVGAPYGRVGATFFDTFYPDDSSGRDTMSFYGGGIHSRFYAWASVIQDGRVVATDYAPDSGWLPVS